MNRNGLLMIAATVILICTVVFLCRTRGYNNEVTVPILLYHHIVDDGSENGTVLRTASFRRQMKLLRDHGYETVTFEDLRLFVDEKQPLPEKPVIITFDDGYFSNYELAYPILKEYDFCATIFVIGSSVGAKEFYKDTDHKLTPHFGQEELDEMVSSGVIQIESHTYDLHQWGPFETGTQIRQSILPLESDSEESYISILNTDIERQNSLFEALGLHMPRVLAFPGGEYISLANDVLIDCGFYATVTTDGTKINRVIFGDRGSLMNLGRLNIGPDITDEILLQYLNKTGQ